MIKKMQFNEFLMDGLDVAMSRWYEGSVKSRGLAFSLETLKFVQSSIPLDSKKCPLTNFSFAAFSKGTLC